MKECLNPYSNGICSRSIKQLKEALKDLESLNPYSNGRSKKFTFDVKKLRRS